MHHKRRLAAFAAHRNRGTERRIGLHQYALQRQRLGGFAKVFGILESNDTGKRDHHSEPYRTFGQFLAGRKTVQLAGERTARVFLLKDPCCVRFRVSRVDDQRQPGLACGLYMRAKVSFLDIARSLVVKEIKPRLANSHDFRMA